jgi:beta-lactamase regulating signal transducer with metallopeptidase domain
MNHAVTVALGSALVHFVWQGALVALLAGLAGAALRRARPATRYALYCGALALMVLAPALTFLVAASSASHPTPVVAAVAGSAAAGSVSSGVSGPGGSGWLSWLVGAWLCGVTIFAARFLGGWALAWRLKRWRTAPAAASLQRAAAALCARLDIRRAVRLLDSAAAEVPSAIGWLRPVVLLPVGALASLTPEQVELLIAHELAHIRRHDYLINLLQTAVETALFYHPAVWWISAQIRIEREHCCDDLAVEACGDAVRYAKALATLEGLRAESAALVVAANGGSLLRRIQRLANGEGAPRIAPPAWAVALVAVAAVVAVALPLAPRRAAEPAETEISAAPGGFLAGLAGAGLTNASVDEIIALKANGLEPRYIGAMRSAGLGPPSVEQLIRLHQHGVRPDFVESIVNSSLVARLTFEDAIRLREHDARSDDMARIRGLGFGPFSADEVIELRRNGVQLASFEALLEAGMDRAGVADAITMQRHDITPDRVRAMKAQGLTNVGLDQIVKLRRAGVI